MEEVKIKINADTGQAEKSVNDLLQELVEVNKESLELQKNTKEVGKAAEKSTKGTSKLAKGFKAVGTAIKAAGIGLIISALASLGAALSNNQRFMDKFNEVVETFSIVMSKVASIVMDVVEEVGKATGGFDALGKVVKGLLTIAITPLKLAFYGIKLGIQEAQLVWEQSFFGGKDKKKITELNMSIVETKNALLETGKEAVDAGKNVVNNFGEAVGSIADVVTKSGEGISKISIKAASETAKANVKIRNAAKLAAAQQQVLVEQYDKQAEKLRQVRDEERNSIEDRKKANDKLLETLNEQATEMRKLADLQVASAQADLAKNNTIENQIALTEALANKKGIEAQIEGFLSEQKANDLALSKEQVELDKLIIQSKNELNIAKKRFIAEGIKDEELRLMMLKEIDAEEAKLEEERLQRVINEAKEGTLARAEAEAELARIREENRQNEIIKEEELDLIRQEKENQKRMDEISMMENRFNQLVAENDLKNSINDQEIARIEAQTLKFKEGTDERAIAEAELAHFKKMVAKDEERRERALSQAKLSMTADALGQIAGMLGENSKVGKAAAAAQAVINTYQGATKALSDLPPPFSYIAAASTIASGLMNVRKILSTNLPKPPSFAKGGGSTGGAIATPSAPPAFNIVGQSQTSQLAQTIASQQNKPVKAYVVADDVSTAQAMDRNIVEGASI